jgi:alanine dehydrogenase
MIGAIYLSSDELDGLADQAAFVDAVREAYRQRGEGAPTKPRITLRSDNPAGMLNGYMAILPDTGVMGGYVYSAGFKDADARFVTPVFDAESGKPLAVIDGAYMNTYKTGAIGAVGIDALARPDATTLALIGSGAQARGQLRGAAVIRDLRDVRVYSLTRAHRETFARDMNRQLDATVRSVDSPEAALEEADMVVTATNASEPVLDADLIEPGIHINAIGQYDPEKREIGAEIVRRAKYVPDLRERAFQDAGSFLLAVEEGVVDEEHIHAELGEIVANRVSGRESKDEVTLFDSGGTALETVASAALLYQRATERGLGRRIEFASASETYEGKQDDTAEEL